MTLAEERAAIGAGISAARKSTSNRVNTAEAGRKASREAIKSGRASTSQEDRRNLGAALEQQRRGTTLKQDLNALETAPRRNQTLTQRQATGGRPETRGVGTWNPNTPKVGGAGGGIAGPLTEPVDESGVPLREYHPPMTITSSDGIFTMELEPIKKLTMIDADGVTVDFIYADPEPDPEPEP